MLGNYVWFLVEEKEGTFIYAFLEKERMSSTEWELLHLVLLREQEHEQENRSQWQNRLVSILRESPEAFAAAMRIEDDLEDISVPWAWPVFLISVRPKDRTVQKINAEVKRTLESLVQNVDETPFVVTDTTLLLGIFPISPKDRELNEGIMQETACALVDGLISESFVEARVVWTSAIRSFPELLRTAQRMLYLTLTAERFVPEQRVLSLRGLGMYELLYSIKPQLGQAYAEHVLPLPALATLGNELEQTVTMFIECDLNISETARRLYLHRNSLLYRIERIRDLTGYDIRRFDDAVTVWSALLLRRM